MALDTIGSIAIHIDETISVPAGISGNMNEIVDMARQHVANFVGGDIGSNSIPAIYQPAILDFSNASVLDLINADSGGADLKLAELSITSTNQDLSSNQLRMMGTMKLNAIGRKARFARSLS